MDSMNSNQQNNQLVDNNHEAHEYCYYPENTPKKKKGKVLKRIAAVTIGLICVVAIGATSIFGYTLITGKRAFSGDEDESSKASDTAVITEGETDKELDSQPVPDREIPTLEQLAALENALPLPEIVKKVSPSVVGVSTILNGGTASGTGFIISEDGYIVTNYHVIEGAQAVSVSLLQSEDGEEIPAQIIGGDEQTDIAVLKIDKTDCVPVTLGKSSELIVGELAITIGNPLGSELSGTVTAGIISALNRKLTIEGREMNLIQTDASINSGNSGGPLINSYGQVVGITSAKVATAYGEGLGFAIPIDEALPIISDLIEHGYVKGRPIVGITGETISDIYAQYYDIPRGFIVREVVKNGPADKAGVQVGDIVIGIEGTLIENMDEFNEIKKNYKAGDTITISVYRNEKIVDLEITLAEDTSSKVQSNQNSQQNNQYNDYLPGFNW
ncbi:MAG: trypsin-like peptidase domain-containing protein [Oscillospiraceae bacterium]|nr:trypsin-like peptidase domain-containing protein [Oscillospiraceae bacterium]